MDDPPKVPTKRRRKETPDFGWPAAMKRATAAAYLDISEDSLVREVSAGRLPKPFTLGGRDHWRKDAIDACLDHLTGGRMEETIPDYLRTFYERYGLDPAEEWRKRRR